MPVIVSSAYVSLETVALLIRALINDMVYSQAGELLTDTSFVLFPLVNDSLEWFTNELANHGVNTFTKETTISAITKVALNDPGVQVNLSDLGYFDGVNATLVPQLPTDLLVPRFMWERQTGSTENWVPMREKIGGLPSITQSQRLALWEWRQDAIYMPGAVQSNDLRLQYEGGQASFATINDTLYFRGAVGPIAYKTVSSYLASRNPEASKLAAAEAMDRLGQLATRNARMKQRVGVTRQSYGRTTGRYPFNPPRNP